jgi:hypothetical protein
MAFTDRKNRLNFAEWLQNGNGDNKNSVSKNDITNVDEAKFARLDSSDTD